MKNYFNDSPIEASEDDRYGVLPFAQSLANSISSIESPVGTTISLNGSWGSGKSSAVNLIKNELIKNEDRTLIVSDFNCWWFRGEEALALAFLQHVHALLSTNLSKKIGKLVPKLAQGLLQAGPVIGSAMAFTPAGPFAAITGASMGFAKRFFSQKETLESTFEEIAEILEQQSQRFLIIVDDIDRLDPEEAIAIFRMIKSVGRLPNVMYLLVFDRSLAEKAALDRYPSEGPQFLEKIIQASFELPPPLQTDLNHAILSAIEAQCGSPSENDLPRIMNVFHDIVAPHLSSPRHVIRFRNAISVTWPAIANEISLADFIALETLRLYEPGLFDAIRNNKANLCGTKNENDRGNRRDESRFAKYLVSVKEERQETAKIALQRIFPRLEATGYGSEFISSWDSERRVCVDSHFDTYFRLSLSSSSLSIERIRELIEKSDDIPYVQSILRKAALSIRRTGTSMVPVILDELNTHATKVPRQNIESLLRALFEIHDEIDLEIDKERGMMAFGETTLRYHWLMRRLTANRFTLDERTALYSSAIPVSSFGWLVDFAASAKDQYSTRDGGPLREEDCLVREDVVGSLVEQALVAIRSAADNQSLLQHKDLIYILYRWRDFLSNDTSEVRAWTDSLLDQNEALVVLAKALTSEFWSANLGMDGLGDRVSLRTVRAQINKNTDILNVDMFKTALEGLLAENILVDDDNDAVSTFLNT